jgi:Kdo2-lipid IVA lauroyltransferase/acyltransferase
MFYFIYALGWLITLLPMRILYLISDLFYPIVYYVARYRRKVVRTNISRSFPEKTDKEIRIIEKRFYRYFCDLFVETMKEMHIGKKEIRKRMTLGSVEAMADQFARGKSIMLMTAHYGNWEWLLNFSEVLPAESTVYQIYKRLRNKKFDTMVFALRERYGGKNIEKRELLRTMFRFKKEEKPGIYVMISDQTPNGKNLHYWTTFLNQDTATVTGTEQLARKFDYPVFYAEINRVKRGYYHCEFIPITLEPNQTEEFEISEKYMRLLEKTIQAHPEYWLWSHRRWKFQRNQETVN